MSPPPPPPPRSGEEEEKDFPTPKFPVIFRHHDSFADADFARQQEEDEAPDEITPAIFIKDPEDWIRFVDKQVRIETDNGDLVEGLVRVIDPVSEAVVVARRTHDNAGRTDAEGRTARDDGTRTSDDKEKAGLKVMEVDLKESHKSRFSVQIIPGHVIKEMSVIGEADATLIKDLEQLFGENDSSDSGAILTEEELLAKREEVKNWLTANRIPVEIGGVKKDVIQVAGKALIIKPPYDVQHCFSLNEIILKKVQQLLRNRKESSPMDS